MVISPAGCMFDNREVFPDAGLWARIPIAEADGPARPWGRAHRGQRPGLLGLGFKALVCKCLKVPRSECRAMYVFMYACMSAALCAPAGLHGERCNALSDRAVMNKSPDTARPLRSSLEEITQ